MNRIFKQLQKEEPPETPHSFIRRMDHRKHINWIVKNFLASLHYVPSTGLPMLNPKTHPLSLIIWFELSAYDPQHDCNVITMYIESPKQVLAARNDLPIEFHERFDDLVEKAKFQMDNDPFLHPENFMKRMLPDGTIIDLSDSSMPKPPKKPKHRKSS